MIQIINLSFQLVPFLTEQNFSTYENNTIIYFDQKSNELYEYAEQIQYNISHNIYAVNCTQSSQLCLTKRIYNPQIAVKYRDMTLFSLDKIQSAQQMLSIIISLESDMFTQKALTQDCYTDFKGVDNWFLVQGPDMDFFQEAFKLFKGKVTGCYVYNQNNKLSAIHKVAGKPLNIEFTKSFDNFYIEQFVNRNRFSVFGKLSENQFQQVIQDFKAVIFVFDPKNETQKNVVKNIRNFVKQIINDGDLIGDQVVFFQSSHKNEFLKALLPNVNFDGGIKVFIADKQWVAILGGNDGIQSDSKAGQGSGINDHQLTIFNDKNTLKDLLEGVVDGNINNKGSGYVLLYGASQRGTQRGTQGGNGNNNAQIGSQDAQKADMNRQNNGDDFDDFDIQMRNQELKDEL